MVPFIIVDIVIVLVLIFFAWRGAKKGLILSLLGLVGLVVAFFGARLISTSFYEPVSNIFEPGIYQNIKDVEAKAWQNLELDETLDNSVSGLIDLLEEKNHFPTLAELLEQAKDSEFFQDLTNGSAAESLASYLADLLAKLALFALSFVVILLVWFLLTHALDLAFKLPILAAINTVGGLLLGLIKAVLVIFILVWIAQLIGWIPQDGNSLILSLFTPKGFVEMLNRIIT